MPANRSRRQHKEEAAVPPEVLGDVRTFLADYRSEIDRWFFLVRMAVGIGLVGYLAIDVMATPARGWTAIAFVAAYIAANVIVWVMRGRLGTHTRWTYAAVDMASFLIVRHVFFFEALVDPNATMVGLFALMLIAYTIYSDAELSRTLAVAALAATLGTVFVDAWRLDPSMEPFFFRANPLRILLLMVYLGSIGLVTTLLANRLGRYVLSHGIELHRSIQASMVSTMERTRREKLEDLNRLKHDFIAVLSHELRTPIAPLRSSLEIVRSQSLSERDKIEMLNIALESASKLQRLVQDYTQLAELLTLERNGTLRWNIRLSTFIEYLCEDACKQRIRLRGLSDLVVSADPRVLGGALLALLRRAELLNSADAIITLSGHAEGKHVVLAVHDPQSYVAPEDTASFDDLFSSSSDRTFGSPNTGLELILAQHSLHRLGGSLRLESSLDEGTTVTCTLPGRQYGIQWLNDAQIRGELQAFAV